MLKNDFLWVVIGAGPAGIAAVGQLIDAHILPRQIAWIDPTFTVGDFGTLWRQVNSNTSIESFIKFYKAFNAFEFEQDHTPFLIKKAKPDGTCPLSIAAEPLRWITNRLRHKTTSMLDYAQALRYTAGGWHVTLASGLELTTQKVILALGAEAMSLPYLQLVTIPLTTALHQELLNQSVDHNDTIAVFGSYQSARNVAENLALTKAKKIIYFYRSVRSFEQHVASLPLSPDVESYPITPTNLLLNIPRCNKAIYAVGFARRAIDVAGLPDDFLYNEKTGVIAPGLYGIGMAFPETIPYTMGRVTYKVSAIWPFVKYLKKIFPAWCNECVELTSTQRLPLASHDIAFQEVE